MLIFLSCRCCCCYTSLFDIRPSTRMTADFTNRLLLLLSQLSPYRTPRPLIRLFCASLGQSCTALLCSHSVSHQLQIP